MSEEFGMKGFEHRCSEEKVEKKFFKKGIHETDIPKEYIDLIWDFYVTHVIQAEDKNTDDLSRSVKDYGWSTTTSNLNGYPALEMELSRAAMIDNFCIIRSKNINNTLKAMGLSDTHICIEHPRAVMKQNYTCDTNENEEFIFASNEPRVCAVFRHIRNAFSHGNTYFFENGNVLLEDKESKSKISAEILVSQKTLLDWICIVDKDGKLYPQLRKW